MNAAQPKELCLALMEADTEETVIELLDRAGYWKNAAYWRYYGDYENNYNTIGNQQIDQLLHPVEFSSVRSEPHGSELDDAVESRRQSRCLQIEGYEFHIVPERHRLGSHEQRILNPQYTDHSTARGTRH